MSISTIFTLAGWALLIGLGLYVFYVISMRSQRRDSKISVLAVAVLLIGSIVLLTLGAGLPSGSTAWKVELTLTWGVVTRLMSKL